eukprot:2731184-Prymnesium_polylepis.1
MCCRGVYSGSGTISGPMSGMCIELAFNNESNILRMDCVAKPEFWVEVDMAYFAQRSHRKRKFEDDTTADVKANASEDVLYSWTQIVKDDAVLA